MSEQRSRDTEPELELRRILHAAGYRYRLHYPVPGNARRKIDIAFTRAHLAVFVDGCFWHACPEHASWPQRNAEWWRRKLEGNASRDRETDLLLRDAGWDVLRFWEHVPVADASEVVIERVRGRA